MNGYCCPVFRGENRKADLSAGIAANSGMPVFLWDGKTKTGNAKRGQASDSLDTIHCHPKEDHLSEGMLESVSAKERVKG